ncbi:MAG: OmpA family protein, partial [Limisphaerales bacterium]
CASPPAPPPPPPPVETGTLIVEVTVEGSPDFDFSKATVTVEGTKDDGSNLSLTLTNRAESVWTEENMALGRFTARAVVTDPPAMSGSAPAAVRSGQTTRAQINLRRGPIIAKAFVVTFRFDKAFVEPCMTEVLERVAAHARDHTDEKLLIVGHTDKTGSSEYNQSLSERRARSVFAYLTFGRDAATAAASEAEWKTLRQPATGGLPQIKDTWGTRQYQYMLQDLEFYRGNIDGDHGPLTSDAVRLFRRIKGLPPGETVDDAVWAALIHDYMAAKSLNVPDKQFLPNAKDGCDGGVLKWLGCGEEDPLPLPSPPTENPFRPYRRVELLFVNTDRLPCEVPEPDTFNLPVPGAVSPTWCLGPGDRSKHACFATRDCAKAKPGQWCIEPAEPGTVVVSGVITFDDGTPASKMKYVLIAPDGEFMDGEAVSGQRRADGIIAEAKTDGTFEYPDKPKGVGTYTMEVIAPLEARRAEDPPEAAKGNVVCTRLEVAAAGAVKAGDGGKKVPVKVGKPKPGGPKVHPHISPKTVVVMVPKPHTTPGSQTIKLTADAGFTGTGQLDRVGAGISFIDKSTNKEISFDGKDNVFPDARLTSATGVEILAKGVTASTKLDEVVLTLTLTPAAGPIPGPPLPAGPPVKATLTAVEVTLDIFSTRTVAGTDPTALPQPAGAAAPANPTDKWFAGRPIHVKSGARGKRALLIVRETKPKTFAGKFELRQVVVSGVTVGALDTKVNLFDTEVGGAAKANVHEFDGPIPPAGKRFFVEGATVSGALRDTGYQLGIKTVDNDGDRIALTVFQVEKIDAKLRGTPCLRDGTRSDPMPAKTSNADSRTFDATAITVVRECGDLRLTATVKPAAIPITWDRERATDDTGLAGLPTHKADTAAPADNKKRLLTADATGSFHVHAFVDVNGNGKRGDDEDGIILNVNMVNIEVQTAVGSNQIITRDTLFNNTSSNAATLVVHSGSTAGGVPAVNAAYTDAEFAKHPLSMKVTVKLTGGGADQRRGVNKIGMGYIQQTPADTFKGTYADGRTLKEAIVANTANPPGPGNQLAFPVRDTRGPSVSGTGPFIVSSSDVDQSVIAAGGQQRIVRFVDPPAIAIALRHPATASALASISGSNDFAVFLSAFSQDFDENYTVIATGSWSITYGTFAVPGGWTNVGAHVTAGAAMTVPARPTPGEGSGVERCPPNFVDNLRMDPT